MTAKERRHTLLMLERWIEPAVSHMGRVFSTHDYIDKLREIYPADYAHDLTLCTFDRGFPNSLVTLHRAIVQRLRTSGLVEVIGDKESRDIRGNKHRTMVWRRLDFRRRSWRPPREPLLSRTGARQPAPLPGMTAADLARARLVLGWSKNALARKLGVDFGAVAGWERGDRRMRPNTAERVRRTLEAAGLVFEGAALKVQRSPVERRRPERA